MHDDYVIETEALSKRYGRKLALDHLDLEIPRGRIHAVVGANGAGKSTLFRILLGFLPPTAGSARILGRDSQRLTPEDRGRIGFVNEEHTLPTWMRVTAVTDMHRRQYPRWNEDAFQRCSAITTCCPNRRSRSSRAANARASTSRSHWRRGRNCWCSTNRRWAWTSSPSARSSNR